jgi:hypothetical protein
MCYGWLLSADVLCSTDSDEEVGWTDNRACIGEMNYKLIVSIVVVWILLYYLSEE